MLPLHLWAVAYKRWLIMSGFHYMYLKNQCQHFQKKRKHCSTHRCSIQVECDCFILKHLWGNSFLQTKVKCIEKIIDNYCLVKTVMIQSISPFSTFIQFILDLLHWSLSTERNRKYPIFCMNTCWLHSAFLKPIL